MKKEEEVIFYWCLLGGRGKKESAPTQPHHQIIVLLPTLVAMYQFRIPIKFIAVLSGFIVGSPAAVLAQTLKYQKSLSQLIANQPPGASSMVGNVNVLQVGDNSTSEKLLKWLTFLT